MHKKKAVVMILAVFVVAVFLANSFAFAHDNGDSHGESCSDIHRDLAVQAPMLRGADVLELQLMLTLAGFDPGQADGVYGEQTAEAVARLQHSTNMSIDGVVTLTVWDKLAELIPAQTVSSGEIPKPQGIVSILINTDTKRLTVYDDDGRELVSFPVAVGKYKTPSPIGEWRIIQKSANRGGALGSRWMRINVPWGTYGIHGTNKPYSIGSDASAGCIRMHNRDVEKLYEIIPHGTLVTIINDRYPAYPPGFNKRNLKKNMTGPDVVEMQKKLRSIGLYLGRADSHFGESTELFVKRYQFWTGQEITGEFTKEDYQQVEQLIDMLLERNL